MSDRPWRVLYVNHEGASGSATRALARMIEHLPAGSVDAHVVTIAGSSTQVFHDAGATVHLVPSVVNVRNIAGVPLRGGRSVTLLREAWRARHGRRLGRIIDAVDPDLVHLNARGMHQAAWLASRRHIPLIAHARSIADHGNALVELLDRRFGRTVAATIAIDRAVQRALPPDRESVVIHNPLSAAAAPGWRSADGMTQVGYVSSLLPHRGVFDVVEAAALLRERSDIEFHLHGTNSRSSGFHRSLRGRVAARLRLTADHEQRLRKRVSEHGVEASVQLTMTVPPGGELYPSLDLLVFPGHTDALPQCVPEAGLYGVPSIVTTDSGEGDIVRDGVTGLVVRRQDPADLAAAIVSLADDPELRRRLGDSARAVFATQFDPHLAGRRTLELYGDVLRRSGHQRPLGCLAPPWTDRRAGQDLGVAGRVSW